MKDEFPFVPAELVKALRAAFVRRITPKSTPAEMWFQGGAEVVINFLERRAADQGPPTQEPTRVFLSTQAEEGHGAGSTGPSRAAGGSADQREEGPQEGTWEP